MFESIRNQSKQLNALFKPELHRFFHDVCSSKKQRIAKNHSIMMGDRANSSYRPVKDKLYFLRIYFENTERSIMSSSV